MSGVFLNGGLEKPLSETVKVNYELPYISSPETPALKATPRVQERFHSIVKQNLSFLLFFYLRCIE